MRRKLGYLLIIGGGLSLAVAGCEGADAAQYHGELAHAAAFGDDGPGRSGSAGRGGTSSGALPDDFDCPGGPVGEIRVSFDCEVIDIVTCRDLSNVVIEYEDGSRQRFEGLRGQFGTFAGTEEHEGKAITGVWVKAGGNSSGDGPGYGERFDAPDDACDEATPDAGTGEPGDPGDDEEECPKDEPDINCGGHSDPPEPPVDLCDENPNAEGCILF